MFLFKFLYFTFFSLLFWGTVQAECVDLSGAYECENGQGFTISKISNVENLDAYEQTVKIEDGSVMIKPFLRKYGFHRIKTACDKNQITEELALRATTIVVSVNLLNEVLTLSTEVSRNSERQRKDEMSCNRI